ncbi:MAG: hypothetical protein EBT45_00620 [Alphaproteobacteria bacterium]|nr:hypothetical protein [Alphaproteobacteria bacterium]
MKGLTGFLSGKKPGRDWCAFFTIVVEGIPPTLLGGQKFGWGLEFLGFKFNKNLNKSFYRGRGELMQKENLFILP